MSKTLLAALGLLAGMMTAAAASAQVPANIPPVTVHPPEPVAEQTFQLFDRLCLATAGDGEAALALADAEGWSEPPPETMGTLDPSRPIKMRRGPPLTVAGDPVTVAVGADRRAAPSARFCMILPGGGVMDPDVLAPLVSRRLGLQPLMDEGQPVWVYSGDGPFSDESALFGNAPILEAARDRPIYTVVTRSVGGRPALTLVRISD